MQKILPEIININMVLFSYCLDKKNKISIATLKHYIYIPNKGGAPAPLWSIVA